MSYAHIFLFIKKIFSFNFLHLSLTDKNEWYKRTDNNGWRLVSDRLIHHLMADPVTWESSNKKYEFNHDKVRQFF